MTPEVGTGQFQLCILSPPPNLQQQQKVGRVVELLCTLILEYIQSYMNLLTPPANNVRNAHQGDPFEGTRHSLNHVIVVFSVHRPLCFNSIPCFPWFASLAFGSCPILARGGGSQWAGAPCTICTTHTN